MKRFGLLMTVLLAVSLLAGCGSDEDENEGMIWDIAGISFCIYITDEEGHDLLDSTFQDNLLGRLTVNYEGTDYPVMTEREVYEKEFGGVQNKTREYFARFTGLVLQRNYNQRFEPVGYRLSFGEFSGDENVALRQLTLFLDGVATHRLAYSNSFRWNKHTPEIDRTFFLGSRQLEPHAQGSNYFFSYSPEHGLVAESGKQ